MKMITTFIIFTLLTLSKAWSAEISSIKVKVNGDAFEAIVYKPDKPKAIVIISPTIGGVSELELKGAEYFSDHGFVVIVLCQFYTELGSADPEVANIDRDYFKPVIAAEALLKQAEDSLHLPYDLPLFAMGASQGGIYSVIIASHMPRVRAAWFSVAGGDLPHVYAVSKIGPIAKFRQRHMKKLGITDPAFYERYLRKNLVNDPLISCQNMNIPFMQVVALRDDIVPTKSQERLARECPAHKILQYNISHGSGTLMSYVLRVKIRQYFEAELLSSLN